jgi:hypothetical protein
MKNLVFVFAKQNIDRPAIPSRGSRFAADVIAERLRERTGSVHVMLDDYYAIPSIRPAAFESLTHVHVAEIYYVVSGYRDVRVGVLDAINSGSLHPNFVSESAVACVNAINNGGKGRITVSFTPYENEAVLDTIKADALRNDAYNYYRLGNYAKGVELLVESLKTLLQSITRRNFSVADEALKQDSETVILSLGSGQSGLSRADWGYGIAKEVIRQPDEPFMPYELALKTMLERPFAEDRELFRIFAEEQEARTEYLKILSEATAGNRLFVEDIIHMSRNSGGSHRASARSN